MTSGADMVVGLDVGTTSAKAVAVDQGGQTVAVAESSPLRTVTTPPGASEQDPDEIWRAAIAAGREVIDEVGGSAQVKSLSLAAQSGSVIVLDAQGSPASRAITWMDTRSQLLVESWTEETNRLIRAVSGWQSSPGLGLATIAWLRSCDALPNPARFTSVDGYLTGQFTGMPLTNPSNAAGMQLMDVTTLNWSDELCALAGIEASALSSVRASGSRAGRLTPAAAAALGVGASTEFVVGGHDQACATLGLDATGPGSIVLSTGTAWVLTVMTDRPAVERLPEVLNLSPHVVDRCWTASKNLGGLGAALAWSLDESSIPSAELDRAIAGSPSADAAPFFLPALQNRDRIAWGSFVNEAGDPDATARVLAVCEACAFEVRAAIDQAGAFTNADTAVTIVGGGTKATRLTQMIANATGRTLVIRPDASWPALGAARLAAAACGWSLTDADSADAVRVEPELGMLTQVEGRYQQYRELREEGSP